MRHYVGQALVPFTRFKLPVEYWQRERGISVFRLRCYPALFLAALVLTLTVAACDDAVEEVEKGEETTYGELASVSAGADYTCGVKADGSLACWGANNFGQASPPQGEFASVSAASNYACGVKTDGSLACWGADYLDQTLPPEGNFSSVSAKYHHACGVRTDGSVECWGDDEFGQASPPQEEFVSVSAGGYHTCGVRTDGSVSCWGNDEYGQASPPQGGYGQVGLAHSGWPQEDDDLLSGDEAQLVQVHDLGPVDGRLEGEVE